MRVCEKFKQRAQIFVLENESDELVSYSNNNIYLYRELFRLCSNALLKNTSYNLNKYT